MSKQSQQFITSVGRLVGGDLYDPKTKDATGNPLVIKKGVDAGKPRSMFDFAVAFPKNGKQWWELATQLANGTTCAFGQIILATAQQAWPGGQWQSPDFAFKIVDGDSTKPNKRGRKPCDQEGFPGHWVFWFSSSFAPRIVNENGSQFILEKDAIKLGDFVQIGGSVASNEEQSNPGVYLNHNVVSFQGYGDRISTGPDPSAMGFGAGGAPAGMSKTPVGGMTAPGTMPPPATAPAAPAFPMPGAPPVAAMAAPAPAAAPPVATQLPVQPHPGFLTPGAGAVAPAAPTVPAATAPIPPVSRQMTALAKGATYETCIAAGWTDALLRQHGMML